MRVEYLQVGEIVTTHGVRGEVKVLTWTDSPEFLTDFTRVRIDGQAYPMEQCRVQKSCCLVKLKGVDTMEAAQALRGKTMEVYRADADPDAIFAVELIGMRVLCLGETIGKITAVLDYPGNKVYIVRGEYEYAIPAVREFILRTDLEENVMEVRLIEGMRWDDEN